MGQRGNGEERTVNEPIDAFLGHLGARLDEDLVARFAGLHRLAHEVLHAVRLCEACCGVLG